MVSNNTLLLVCNNVALLFRACNNLDCSFFDVFLCDSLAVLSCSKESCFVGKVFKLSTCKAGCGLGNSLEAYVWSKRLVLCVYLEDFLSALDVRVIYCNLTVETSRTEKCGVKDILTVCSSR